jgi:hypothetical protein
MDGAGHFLNGLVDCLLAIYREISRESIFKASPESGVNSVCHKGF